MINLGTPRRPGSHCHAARNTIPIRPEPRMSGRASALAISDGGSPSVSVDVSVDEVIAVEFRDRGGAADDLLLDIEVLQLCELLGVHLAEPALPRVDEPGVLRDDLGHLLLLV